MAQKMIGVGLHSCCFSPLSICQCSIKNVCDPSQSNDGRESSSLPDKIHHLALQSL